MAFEGTFGQKKFGTADALFPGPSVVTTTQASLLDTALGSEVFSVTALGGAQTISFADSVAGSELFRVTLPITVPPAAAIPAARVEIHASTGAHALVEILENAKDVGYEFSVNASPQAWFTLPRDDPKWANVVAFAEVWIYDAFQSLVGVFRVMPTKELDDSSGTFGIVTCEGYATVLQDDLVAAEVIWTNQTVTQILSDLLAYQAVPRVTLGTIDPSLNVVVGGMRVAYENVMKGCWEVRNVVGGYISVDHVPSDPSQRKLNLRATVGQDIGQRVRSGFNLAGIGKATDPTQAVTKLYPLGRGEGQNQQRPSTDLLIGQAVNFVAGGAGRSTLTIAERYSRYKGWSGAGAVLPNGQTAGDLRIRPLTVWRNGVNDSANWEQGADERTIRSKTNGYNPGGSWTIDYVHADYLIADDTIGTYGVISQAYPDKRFETSGDLLRAARLQLDIAKAPSVSYDVKVVDVARLYPDEPLERIALYDQIQVYNPRLGVATKLRVVKVRYADMWDPESLSITVGQPDQVDVSVLLQDRQRKYETMADGATNIWTDSFADNLDGAHPYQQDIYVPPDAVSVNKIALNLRRKPYRYYVSTGTAASGGNHAHQVGQNSRLGPFTSTAAVTAGPGGFSDAQGMHDHGQVGEAFTGNHSHNLNWPHSHPHGHSYVDIFPDPITSTANDHIHVITITPGIVETTTPTLIVVDVDGNVASSSTSNLQEFDLTPYLSKNNVGKIVRGWHTVTFNGGQGRIQGSVVVQVFLQSRGVIAG